MRQEATKEGLSLNTDKIIHRAEASCIIVSLALAPDKIPSNSHTYTKELNNTAQAYKGDVKINV